MVELRQNSSPARAKVRCAIYTRKSSEEGLEQEFNSLDAQREACEAYVTSQKHEGWTALATLYDDGAYSGGTMDRPALQRLLDDIRAGKIDVVVVYKVDRLTRSLADFAKIVEVFDAQGASFVSVTQALSARWEHLPTDTLHDLTRSILVRAQVHADRIDLEVGSARLVSWLLNDSAGEGTVEGNRTSSANADGSEQTLVRLSIRASLKRTGKEMKFIVEGVTNSAPADTTLIRLLVRGQKIAKRMFGSNCPPLEAIAHEERITASYATRLVRLAFLAPDIVAAILAGKQPPGLTANKLMADTRLPLDWQDQRAALGFA